MSHFTRVKTVIKDRDWLATALRQMGFPEVEVHDQAQHLYGYQGDRREQTAEVIVRRQYVGRASNDLGFKENHEGAYDAIISEYDRRQYDDQWLGQLNQRYAHLAVKQQVLEQGLIIEEERVLENGEIEILVCERF